MAKYLNTLDLLSLWGTMKRPMLIKNTQLLVKSA